VTYAKKFFIRVQQSLFEALKSKKMKRERLELEKKDLKSKHRKMMDEEENNDKECSK